MPEEGSWSWIERAFKRVPVPYPLISIILFIISYLIYFFLSKRVECLSDPHEWDMYTKMQIVSVCFLVSYMTAGVRYFIDNMRYVFKNMKAYPKNENKLIDLNNQLEWKFIKSKIFYIIVFLVVIPFIAIDPIRGEYHYFSLYEDRITIWTIFLDVFNFFISVLILYSMATILWIIFNISWVLKEIERGSHQDAVRIDLFNVDKVGGIKSIRDLILKLVVFQFIAISFGIFSFVMPDKIIYHEVIFLITLFIITVCFFIFGWYMIHKLLEGERNRTIDRIDQLYTQQHQRMEDIISGGEYWDRDEKLERILTSMKFLQNEIARVKPASKRAYNLKSIIIFVSSSLIPIITTYILPLMMPTGSEQHGEVVQNIEFFNQHVLTFIHNFLQIFV